MRIAVDMVNERLIPKKEAVLRVEPEQLDRLLHPSFDPKAKRTVIATGLPASPGAAVGQAVFAADTAEAWKAKGKRVISAKTSLQMRKLLRLVVENGTGESNTSRKRSRLFRLARI